MTVTQVARKQTTVQMKTSAEFQKWLKLHPTATMTKKVKKFDQIADEIYGR
jgi:hypothetical protein